MQFFLLAVPERESGGGALAQQQRRTSVARVSCSGAVLVRVVAVLVQIVRLLVQAGETVLCLAYVSDVFGPGDRTL